MPNSLSATFVNHAADVLGGNYGLSAQEIVRACRAYATEYAVDIPHPTIPYEAVNKRTALAENIKAFQEPQRYQIIKELCDHPTIAQRNQAGAQKLKLLLITRYSHLAPDSIGAEVNETLIEQTRHWLDPFPGALALYNEALAKHEHGVFQRNVLDDLRLSLEKVIQDLLGNNRSLENQIPAVGEFVKARGGSPEFTNMFVKLIEYYTRYQNTYVKHDDAVIEEEVEFVIELTSSFMKHLVRLSQHGAV
jgi:hypothetical protein